MARSREQRAAAEGHGGGPGRSLVDAELSGRHGPVPESYERSAEKAIAWLKENRASLTDIPTQYIDHMLVDLALGGIAVLRAALYRCAELRDGKGVVGVRK